jgi:membrane associated rhomboid family serine protease
MTMMTTRLSHTMRLLGFFLLAVSAFVGVPLCEAFVASPRSVSTGIGRLMRAPTATLRLYRGDEDDPFMPCEAARNGVFNDNVHKGPPSSAFHKGPQGPPPADGNRYDINGNDVYDQKPQQGRPTPAGPYAAPKVSYRAQPKAGPQGPPPADGNRYDISGNDMYDKKTPQGHTPPAGPYSASPQKVAPQKVPYRQHPKAFKSFARSEAKPRTTKTRTMKPMEVIEVPYHSSSPLRERLDGWRGAASRMVQEYQQKLRRGERATGSKVASGTSTLLNLHAVFFAYQCLTTLVFLLSGRHAGIRNVNPAVAAVTGVVAMSAQPLTKDWMFSASLARWQPHRYITAGFAHSSLLSLLLNVDALRRLPGWLEKASGSAVYLTTFLLSSVVGHLGHAAWGGRGVSLGASTGICGLYGLYVVSLLRHTKQVARTTRDVWIGLGRQLIYGLTLSYHGSTVSHLVGFATGMAAAYAYTFDHDDKMIRPQGSPKVSTMALWSTWVVALTALVLVPNLRPIPGMIVQSLFRPGSLTPARFL